METIMFRRTVTRAWVSVYKPGLDAHNCHLPPCVPSTFWDIHDVAVRRDDSKKTKGYFSLPTLDYDAEGGVAPLFSPLQLKIHMFRYHQELVDELNERTLGTIFEAQPLDVVIRKTAMDATQVSLYHAASQHFNHSFFWKCIVPHGAPMPQSLKTALMRQYKSIASFEEKFQHAAASIHGSGWVFLVWTDIKFEILALTDPGGSPISMDYVPLCALDMWEHARYIDYETDRESYVRNFFKVINWKLVAKYWDQAISQENV